MKRIKPHPLFAIWRADEAAECLHLPNDTYEFIWNKIVPMMPKKPDREEPTYEYPLKNFWSQIPDHHRIQLNDAARLEDEKERNYRAEVMESHGRKRYDETKG